MLTKYTSFLFNISSMNLISSSLNSRLLFNHEAWKCRPNGARLVEKWRLKLCLSRRPNCSPVWMFEHESTMWQPAGVRKTCKYRYFAFRVQTAVPSVIIIVYTLYTGWYEAFRQVEGETVSRTCLPFRFEHSQFSIIPPPPKFFCLFLLNGFHKIYYRLSLYYHCLDLKKTISWL